MFVDRTSKNLISQENFLRSDRIFRPVKNRKKSAIFRHFFGRSAAKNSNRSIGNEKRRIIQAGDQIRFSSTKTNNENTQQLPAGRLQIEKAKFSNETICSQRLKNPTAIEIFAKRYSSTCSKMKNDGLLWFSADSIKVRSSFLVSFYRRFMTASVSFEWFSSRKTEDITWRSLHMHKKCCLAIKSTTLSLFWILTDPFDRVDFLYRLSFSLCVMLVNDANLPE